jgi:hypothetical protein
MIYRLSHLFCHQFKRDAVTVTASRFFIGLNNIFTKQMLSFYQRRGKHNLFQLRLFKSINYGKPFQN